MKEKYRCRIFKINGCDCSWQVMMDCSDKCLVCDRIVHSIFVDDEVKTKVQKTVRVPKPRMTSDEKAAANNLFKMFKTKKEDRNNIVEILLRDRWQNAAEEQCEKLAKADWEKYGKGKCA